MKKLLLIAVISLVLTDWANAQITNCAQTLRLARSTYEQGRLHELPTLMGDCFKKQAESGGFTKQQKVEGYQLLTLAYIYLEEPEKADESMLELLRTDPYFRPNPEVDPAEFIALFKTFRTRPVYRLGVKFNLNSTQPNVVQFNPISNGTGEYNRAFGFGGSFVGEVPITDDLTLNGELGYSLKSFTNKFESFNPGETVPYATSSGTEKQTWITLPVMAQYRVKEGKFNPFVTGGVSVDYLLTSSVASTQKRPGAQSIEEQSFDVKSQREKLNLSLLAGAGIKLRIAGGYLVSEVRYTYGLSKVNSESTLLANQALLFNYGYVDGIFKLNSLSFSIGYVQNFFNPKKLKRKATR